jgi:hypothetical protein
MSMLDLFAPTWGWRVTHRVPIHATPQRVMAAARRMSLADSRLVRAIFWLRECMVGAEHRPLARTGVVDYVQSIGWGLLAENGGQEIVLGAVTQPWQPAPVFHPISPDRFASFVRPDHVKIVWNLKAEPRGRGQTLLTAETRVIPCDDQARRHFRRYWWIFSPGIWLIRELLLRPLRRRLERSEPGQAG